MKPCPYCAEAIQDAATVCRFCDRTVVPARGGEPGSVLARVLRGGEVLLGSAAMAGVAYLLAAHTGLFPMPAYLAADPGTAAEAAAPPPLVLSLLEAQAVDIEAGEHFDTTFVVSDPRPCTFSGRVDGLAGGDRDVEVYLLDELGYDQWHDGVHPAALFESGRASSARLEVTLPRPGKYALLVSNRYSIFTDKTVQMDEARVVCQ